jgi:hypothetical protein
MFNIWEIPFAVTATMADPIEFLKVTAEEAASERSLGADFVLWLSMTQKLNVKKKTECNGSANRSIHQTKIADTTPAQIANLAIFDCYGL